MSVIMSGVKLDQVFEQLHGIMNRAFAFLLLPYRIYYSIIRSALITSPIYYFLFIISRLMFRALHHPTVYANL